MRGEAAANDNMDYERIGRFIYGFHRVCGSVEQLNQFAARPGVPPELAARASSLAQKFEHILTYANAVGETELDATLQEAVDLQAEIDRLFS